jgi:hypothetical protein
MCRLTGDSISAWTATSDLVSSQVELTLRGCTACLIYAILPFSCSNPFPAIRDARVAVDPLSAAAIGMKRKLVASEPDETHAPRKNDVLTKDEPTSHHLPLTRSKRPSTLSSQRTSDAASTPPTPLPVEDSLIALSISRPLEPTPALHTLPVDESFCPSGFNMLEILVV